MDRKRLRSSSNSNVLSPREREIMVLAVRGFANKTIAQQLSVTEGTVKLHLHHIYQKLGINSRYALAALAKDLPALATRKRGTPSDAA
jgi:DNA-binding NarL/FixJ family response regulator